MHIRPQIKRVNRTAWEDFRLSIMWKNRDRESYRHTGFPLVLLYCESRFYHSRDPTHITDVSYQWFLFHLHQVEESLGPGIGQCLKSFHRRRWMSWAHGLWWLWGLTFFCFWYLGTCSKRVGEFVPAYTSSSIFCKKLRSGDAGERNNVSGERGSGFPVAVICCPGFSGCFPESHPWVLSLGAVVVRHSLSVMSSVGRTQLV